MPEDKPDLNALLRRAAGFDGPTREEAEENIAQRAQEQRIPDEMERANRNRAGDTGRLIREAAGMRTRSVHTGPQNTGARDAAGNLEEYDSSRNHGRIDVHSPREFTVNADGENER